MENRQKRNEIQRVPPTKSATSKFFCKDRFSHSQNAEEISEQNAKVIESRNQGSVELTLFESYVSCLSSPQTLLLIRVLSSLNKRKGRTHSLYYRPIRVPDRFTFGRPAPRVGLNLAPLSSVLPATLALLARLSLFWCAGENEVQFLELLNPYV